MGDAGSAKKTIYFGYGSNMWQKQMKKRCPKSIFLGIAKLWHYKWIISERGYANVVKSPETDDKSAIDYVWGLVYSLTPSDEDQLDQNEGVPKSYQKEYIECDFHSKETVDGHSDEPDKEDMLVYISKDFITPSDPKKEYIVRMNHAIDDAIEAGVPKEYIKKYLRPAIPEEEDDTAREMAEKQALHFVDGR
ncbi:hypothetical protein MRB53_042348 [Persea americana]|nr:hypothetical protein MRB53_042348 [Persea americana]